MSDAQLCLRVNAGAPRRGDGGSKGPRRARVQLWPELLGCARAGWHRPGRGEDKDARKTPGPFSPAPIQTQRKPGFSRSKAARTALLQNSQEGSKSGNALIAHVSLRQPFLTRLLTFDRTSYETVQLERFFKTELRADQRPSRPCVSTAKPRISEARVTACDARSWHSRRLSFLKCEENNAEPFL